jgi:hypothetical protein
MKGLFLAAVGVALYLLISYIAFLQSPNYHSISDKWERYRQERAYYWRNR